MIPMATAAGFPCYGGGASTVGAGVVRPGGWTRCFGHPHPGGTLAGTARPEAAGTRRGQLQLPTPPPELWAATPSPWGLESRPDQQPIHQPAQQFEQRPPGPPKGCRHRQRGGGPREKCDNGPVQPRGLDTAGRGRTIGDVPVPWLIPTRSRRTIGTKSRCNTMPR